MPNNGTVIDVGELEVGLVLIAHVNFPIPEVPKGKDPPLHTGGMKVPITLLIPTNTKRVSFSVTSVHLWFGSFKKPDARKVERIVWGINQLTDLPVKRDRKFNFEFLARLDGEPAGKWGGLFNLQVDCFA